VNIETLERTKWRIGMCPGCGYVIHSWERVRGWSIYTLYHERCFGKAVMQ